MCVCIYISQYIFMQPIDPLSMFSSFRNFEGTFTVYNSIGLKPNVKFMKDKALKLIKNLLTLLFSRKFGEIIFLEQYITSLRQS